MIAELLKYKYVIRRPTILEHCYPRTLLLLILMKINQYTPPFSSKKVDVESGISWVLRLGQGSYPDWQAYTFSRNLSNHLMPEHTDYF